MRFHISILILLLLFSECFAVVHVDDSTTVSTAAHTSMPVSSLPQEGELSDIRFEGNSYFSGAVLADAISLRPTNLSFTHQIFGFYYRQFSINPYTPTSLRDALATTLRGYQDEYRFFDQTSAENDAFTLINLYNQNGFHNATVTFSFTFDSTERLNILTFHIVENKPFTVDTIVYTGLDSLSPALRADLDPFLREGLHSQFNESAIKRNAEQIMFFLQNNGYYFAGYNQPVVTTLMPSASDSITIPFTLGNRCRIGTISLKHDYRDQPAVSSDLIIKMLDFSKGDWFSRSSFSRSQVNLYNLGTFDLVVIDTSGSTTIGGVTTLSIQVLIQYRKLREISAAPFINHTTYDNFTNSGVELAFLHRNLFGAAQSFSFFSRFVWQDFGIKLPADPHFPYIFTSISREFQTGFQFSQPYFFSLWSWKVGLTVQASYSNRKIQSGLPFQTVSLGVTSLPARLTFPITLPSFTLFNSLILEYSTELQNIDNIADVSGDMFAHGIDTSVDADPESNKRNIGAITEFLYPYYQIDAVTQGHFKYLGSIVSITAIGDNRNNPFSPLNGNFLAISTEIADGPLYRFSRHQITYYKFWNIVSNDVFAVKFRAGYIDINLEDGAFIPFEKRFFAGGANSVRSYPSRALYDRKSSNLDTTVAYTNNLTGNGAILEGSVEYRYRFSRPRGLNTTVADQIEQLGITFFMDWGNVYNRIDPLSNTYNSATLNDIFKGLAVGIGAGIRRETPVGPVRVDFAVRLYDPTSPDRLWIFSRAPFKDIQIHIGLGHAF